jgi:hypothetical protein
MSGESQQAPGTIADPTVLTTEQLMREIKHVHDLMAAQQATVQTHFKLLEGQRVELKGDTGKAVDAALTSAKDAVAAVAKSVDDLKERIVKMESASGGERRAVERGQDRQQPWQLYIMGVALALFVLYANGKLG